MVFPGCAGLAQGRAPRKRKQPQIANQGYCYRATAGFRLVRTMLYRLDSLMMVIGCSPPGVSILLRPLSSSSSRAANA